MKDSLALAMGALLAMAVVADNPPTSGVVVVSDQRHGRLIGPKLGLLALLGIKAVGLKGVSGAAGTAGVAVLGDTAVGNKGVYVTPTPVTPPILVIETKHRETYYPVPAKIAHPSPASTYYPVPAKIVHPSPASTYYPVPAKIVHPSPASTYYPVPAKILHPSPAYYPVSTAGAVVSVAYKPVYATAYHSSAYGYGRIR